jgi:hypothetical protein
MKKRDKLDIRDYAELYARRLNLPATKSLMFVSPPQYMIPFEKWAPLTTGGEYEALPWWQVYNHLKHSRIEHIKKATLANAVNSLCGLHQVIVKLPELVRATARHGWFPTQGVHATRFYLTDIGADLKNISQGQGHQTFLVESKLFIVPLGPKPFPEDIADLDPTYYYCSPRLSSFLCRGL